MSSLRVACLPLTVVILLCLSACGGHVNHVVQPGDTLYSIGFSYGQDYQDIARWNRIDAPYVIHHGDILRVAPPVRKWWQQQSDGSVPHSAETATASAPSTPRRRQAGRDNVEQSLPALDWPTKGHIVAGFSLTPPQNKGIDIAGQLEQEIQSTAAGTVVYSGSGLIGFGKIIIIKHNKTYLSAYAYNERLFVKEGDAVAAGQVIAAMGRGPNNEPRLHFEIRRNGIPVDPMRYLNAQGR